MAETAASAGKPAANYLVQAWHSKSLWLWLLLPLVAIYWLLTALRRKLYSLGFISVWQSPVPVIVVGNITVGGTGKTPLVISLVEALQQAGYQPGIVSRGYGSQAPHYPFRVTPEQSPQHSGDEPLLMAIRTGVPVVIGADRIAAAQDLIDHYGCDVIVSDDGLQHYRLQRNIEIVVVDGQRGFANRLLLPAGPLREPLSRLRRVDFIVRNGGTDSGWSSELGKALLNSDASYFSMQLQPGQLNKLDGSQAVTPDNWQYPPQVHAVAGIGNPDRFYHSLRQLGLQPTGHDFVDHHHYKAGDLEFDDELPVIMTEKDAVKVRSINYPENSWYLPVSAELDKDFFAKVLQLLPPRIQVNE